MLIRSPAHLRSVLSCRSRILGALIISHRWSCSSGSAHVSVTGTAAAVIHRTTRAVRFQAVTSEHRIVG